MEIVGVLLVCALVFGICFLVDKGFATLFRNQKQHKSGHAVRLNKKYGSIGLIVAVLGVAALFYGLKNGVLLIAGGCLLILIGAALVVYYVTFGIFYDGDSFLVTSFAKPKATYKYKDIFAQQLYNSYGSIVVELHLMGGRTIQLQTGMEGVYPFLDHAFSAWLQQTGKKQEDCPFYDPDNSCWFPPVE